MKLDIGKPDLIQARACMDDAELFRRASVSAMTLWTAHNKKQELKRATIGKLVKALSVDVTEIIMEE